ncbi:unnamed protein product [Arabis nemorensis]|uniref:Uncharacterized protein n=1 Tax=Arabis nemorensis TaxID=586526 RepID=A0A565CT09_9BRAS|nr:unnamed protein product [Arabis nemorensis]
MLLSFVITKVILIGLWDGFWRRGFGRGFVVFHSKFAENYRFYSRSHFVKGIELMILLLVVTWLFSEVRHFPFLL